MFKAVNIRCCFAVYNGIQNHIKNAVQKTQVFMQNGSFRQEMKKLLTNGAVYDNICRLSERDSCTAETAQKNFKKNEKSS